MRCERAYSEESPYTEENWRRFAYVEVHAGQCGESRCLLLVHTCHLDTLAAV